MTTIVDLFNCAGWRAINRIAPLVNIHNVFFQNWLELQQLLKEIYDNIENSQDIQERAFYNLQQKIFNYLAASSVLTDMASKLMSHYKETTFLNEYNQKITELFKNNNLSAFIRNLRNYQTHYELTFPYPVRSLENGKHWDVVLISAELLEHKKEWNTQAKQFIKSCGEEINLTKIFTEYANIINAFYLWVYTKFSEYHKNDLKEREQLIKAAGMYPPESNINPLNLSSDQCEDILNKLKNG